jgi:hypothetical protein
MALGQGTLQRILHQIVRGKRIPRQRARIAPQTRNDDQDLGAKIVHAYHQPPARAPGTCHAQPAFRQRRGAMPGRGIKPLVFLEFRIFIAANMVENALFHEAQKRGGK